MAEDKLVSVLMTAYNREFFLGEAIESVLASTYKNVELIIVDDGSKDSTLQIAKNYAKDDSRIRVYENEKNLGDYPNRNKAASYANGIYIMNVDSDDQIFPDTIEKVVAIMEMNPDVPFGIYSPLVLDHPVKLDLQTAVRNHFFKEPFLMYGPGAMVFTNEYFKKIKGFPEKYGPANDMYFNLKAASQAPVILFPFELVNYRRHEGQEINNNFSYLSNNYLYQRDALAELVLPLTDGEKRYLADKNKRRFTVNLIRFFLKEKNMSKLREVLHRTGFGMKDVMQGVFHWYSKRPKP